MGTEYGPEIRSAALQYGLDPALVTAVVLQESSGRTDAFRFEPGVWGWFAGNPKAAGLVPRRAASSYGLMQVLFATATDYGFSADPELLFIPRVGLDFGCRHLAELLKWAKGDVAKALAAYNGGKGNADKAQPRRYAAEVLARLGALKAGR
jgi:soluble lytic murein transglycosylase-like protein